MIFQELPIFSIIDMCLNPQHLSNRGYSFNKSSDRLLLQVPCGECEECKAQRINDWIVRLYFEHLYTEKQGGFVCFPTFTFDNDHLPYINLLHPFKTDKVSGKKVLYIHHGIKAGDIVDTFHKTAKHPEYMSCVDRELWHKFTNSLKTYLSKIGYSCKWFYCWQYGETYGRVHIHAKMHIFPNETYDPTDTHNRRHSSSYCLHPSAFLDFLKEHWKHGDVSASSLGFVVNDANKSSRYVSRYAVRDTSFEREFELRQSAYLREYDKNKKSPKFKFYEPLTPKEVRQIRPFVYSSANLGVSAVLHQTQNDVKHQTITLPKQDTFVSVSLPLYLKRKYFFETNGDNRYMLTKEPKEIIFEALPKKTAHMTDSEYDAKVRKLHSLTYSPAGTSILPIVLKDNIQKLQQRYEKTIEIVKTIGTHHGLSLHVETIDSISRISMGTLTSSLECRRYILDLVDHLENTFPTSCSRSLSIYRTLYKGYLDITIGNALDIDTWYFYHPDCIDARIKAIMHRTFALDSENVDTLGRDDSEFKEVLDEEGNVTILKYNILTKKEAYDRVQSLLPYLFDRHYSFEGFNDLLNILDLVDAQIRADEIKQRQLDFKKKQAVKDYKNRLKYDKEN